MEATFMTKEDIEAAIDRGDQDIINRYMAGGIKIGTPPAEEIVEEQVQEEVPVEEVPERIITNDEVEAMKAEYERTIAEERKAREDAIMRANEAVAEAVVAKPNVEPEPVPAIKLDDEDGDDAALAGIYARNNRKLIESLKNSTSSSEVEELKAQLEILKEEAAERAAKAEAAAARDAEAERQNKLFGEVDSFTNSYGQFSTGKPTQEAFAEISSFKDRLSEYIKSANQADIDKAYHMVVTGEDQKLAKGLETAGVSVPECANNYLKLTEIVDLKNGFQFNKYTGKYDEVKDNFGNRVVQRSIEDAYKLSRFSDLITNARKDEATKIQDQLARRSNSASTLSDSDLASPADGGTMTNEQKMEILSLPNSVIAKNPALKQKLDMIISGAI